MFYLQKKRSLCQRLSQQARKIYSVSWASPSHYRLFSRKGWTGILFLRTRWTKWWHSVRPAELLWWFWQWSVPSHFPPTVTVPWHYCPYTFHQTPDFTLKIPKAHSSNWSYRYWRPTKHIKPPYSSIRILDPVWRTFQSCQWQTLHHFFDYQKAHWYSNFPQLCHLDQGYWFNSS